MTNPFGVRSAQCLASWGRRWPVVRGVHLDHGEAAGVEGDRSAALIDLRGYQWCSRPPAHHAAHNGDAGQANLFEDILSDVADEGESLWVLSN